MFIGEYRHNMDSKGRLFLPVRFRENLGGEFVICRGIDKCVCIYPMDEWKKFSAKLQRLSIRDREIKRHFENGANIDSVDNQGRVTIPQVCSKYASLGKEVVITGNTTYIEIWAAEVYDGKGEVTTESIVDAFAALELADRMGE